MTYQTEAHANEAAYEAEIARIAKQAQESKQRGEGIHCNPYDYRFESIAADYWDKAWMAAK